MSEKQKTLQRFKPKPQRDKDLYTQEVGYITVFFAAFKILGGSFSLPQTLLNFFIDFLAICFGLQFNLASQRGLPRPSLHVLDDLVTNSCGFCYVCKVSGFIEVQLEPLFATIFGLRDVLDSC